MRLVGGLIFFLKRVNFTDLYEIANMNKDISKLVDGYQTAFVNNQVVSDPHFRAQFISNTKGQKVVSALEKELSSCDRALISVAFITEGGIEPLMGSLKELENKEIPVKILTTDYLLFSDPKALDRLNNLKNIELKVFKTLNATKGFHTKGYLFFQGDYINVIVGSSNLTQKAITANHEWNTRIVSTREGQYAIDIENEFNTLWSEALNYSDYREEYVQLFEDNKHQKFELDKIVSNITVKGYSLSPNEMQEHFCRNIERLVNDHQKRALLISATGTGKTYASAFAIRDLLDKRLIGGSGKILFISHREQINKQAKKSYSRVFGGGYKMELLSGNNNNKEKLAEADFIFSTIQTISKENNLQDYSKDAFSVIILDECHRSGASSYQKIIDYFSPQLLLGMTASPERTDGYDIFNLFDHNIACEIRLKDAMENDLLCPFHYFGISDIETDDNLTEDDPLFFNRLISEERVRHVISNAEYYGYYGDRVKGLIFCSSKKEAKELSRLINCSKKQDGTCYKTVHLSGDDTQEARESAIQDLIKGELDYILTVDIFNEGVDIPEINQIIMLRPTESPIVFVQQLGRGLRKAENKEFVVIIDFIGNYNNNYMIPIALSGDRTGNKDNIRRSLFDGNNYISGASTIYFDEISKQKIYRSIDTARLNETKKLRMEYENFKNKIGRIPTLSDFDTYGELDPLRIIDKFGSYNAFLDKYDSDYKLLFNRNAHEMLQYLSQKIASGKRPHELELLSVVSRGCRPSEVLSCWKRNMLDKYGLAVDKYAERTVINVLSNRFYNIGAAKDSFKNCGFIENSDCGIEATESFALLLHNDDFKNELNEILRFGISRFLRDYRNQTSDNSFVLYKKYSYEDVCRLLNWEKNQVATNIGGYKYDAETNTYPVFINYDKDDDINESIKYEDRFVSPTNLIAVSKNKRTPSSPDILKAVESGTNPDVRMELFVRKNKDDNESKEFYYLGRMRFDTEQKHLRQITMPQKAVEIGYKLYTPVESGLYEYITKARS